MRCVAMAISALLSKTMSFVSGSLSFEGMMYVEPQISSLVILEDHPRVRIERLEVRNASRRRRVAANSTVPVFVSMI